KAYGLIQRFSEDVDFTVFREDPEFQGDRDLASSELSGKKRKKLVKDLQQATCNYICNQLKNDLEAVAATLSSDCGVLLDSEDSDQSTLLFHYPTLFGKDSEAYVQPRVKLEGGGRSALDPHEPHIIKPLIASVLDGWDFAVPNVVTIRPERTFWDKVMILHGWHCGHRDEDRLPSDRQRLSRHYYDVAMIYKTEIGKAAIQDANLREDVRQHTIRFFNRAWMKLEDAIPGSIRLFPGDGLLKALQQDYQAMQGMMLGTVPDFQEILAELATLEEQINQQA
ncbi:MAG: nucleotidyl transferase AbiEii/AbiGii toxin family protein, partial [Acaryochloris sp. SU_5_25]|nr:nucleotidyl transferase AbiEii/AbiGii toxin family protein [Acaryochloris sp. SU_5_25]